MKRIAVFASGSGTNAESLIKALNFHPTPSGRVILVVSNKNDAPVIQRVKQFSVPSFVFPNEQFENSQPLISFLNENKIDVVVLAGFLRKISPELIRAFPERIVNIHPALLPKHGGKGMYGINVHRAVISAGEDTTGITIHLVNEDYDKGKVIYRESCPVVEGDTPEKLAARVQEIEHRAYPQVINQWLTTF